MKNNVFFFNYYESIQFMINVIKFASIEKIYKYQIMSIFVVIMQNSYGNWISHDIGNNLWVVSEESSFTYDVYITKLSSEVKTCWKYLM